MALVRTETTKSTFKDVKCTEFWNKLIFIIKCAKGMHVDIPSSKDREMAGRLKKDGCVNLEVGTKAYDIFIFWKVKQARCHWAVVGLRVEATHLVAGSHTGVPLAQGCLPLPGILRFSKLVGR
jgi:hypothetical protein